MCKRRAKRHKGVTSRSLRDPVRLRPAPFRPPHPSPSLTGLFLPSAPHAPLNKPRKQPHRQPQSLQTKLLRTDRKNAPVSLPEAFTRACAHARGENRSPKKRIPQKSSRPLLLCGLKPRRKQTNPTSTTLRNILPKTPSLKTSSPNPPPRPSRPLREPPSKIKLSPLTRGGAGRESSPQLSPLTRGSGPASAAGAQREGSPSRRRLPHFFHPILPILPPSLTGLLTPIPFSLKKIRSYPFNPR